VTGLEADALPSLQELSLYYNKLEDVNDLVLILSKFLVLNVLDLRLNPLCGGNYRSRIIHSLPALTRLDECNVKGAERNNTHHDLNGSVVSTDDDEDLFGSDEDDDENNSNNSNNSVCSAPQIERTTNIIHMNNGSAIKTSSAHTPKELLLTIADSITATSSSIASLEIDGVPAILQTINNAKNDLQEKMTSLANSVEQVLENSSKPLTIETSSTQTDSRDDVSSLHVKIKVLQSELAAEREKNIRAMNELEAEKHQRTLLDSKISKILQQTSNSSVTEEKIKQSLVEQTSTSERLKQSHHALMESNRLLLVTLNQKNADIVRMSEAYEAEGKKWQTNFALVLQEGQKIAKNAQNVK